MKVWQFRSTHYVYRLFDEHGTPLYVGCSLDPEKRIRAHWYKPWGERIFQSVITEHINRPAALAVERREIGRLNPAYNLVHTSRNPHLKINRAKASR